jgi:pimeloyl-ACP methyl ester carboxylesterase
MATHQLPLARRKVQTASGRIAYAEQGAGPVVLFVHGVLLNGYLWRHQRALSYSATVTTVTRPLMIRTHRRSTHSSRIHGNRPVGPARAPRI